MKKLLMLISVLMIGSQVQSQNFTTEPIKSLLAGTAIFCTVYGSNFLLNYCKAKYCEANDCEAKLNAETSENPKPSKYHLRHCFGFNDSRVVFPSLIMGCLVAKYLKFGQ